MVWTQYTNVPPFISAKNVELLIRLLHGLQQSLCVAVCLLKVPVVVKSSVFTSDVFLNYKKNIDARHQ